MKVLVHLARRKQNTGARISLLQYADALRRRGHEVRVLLQNHTPSPSEANLYRWADRVIVQGERRYQWIRTAVLRQGARVVFRVPKSGRTPTDCGFPPSSIAAVWWSSGATRARSIDAGTFDEAWRNFVLWPLVWPSRYRTTPGRRVAAINLAPRKGGEYFWPIVRACPSVPFLGVRGGWHLKKQIVPEPLPPNARVLRYQRDPKVVYSQTRVLLMLTADEAFGRVAIEAAASGIPVIAHDDPGVREAMGDHATYLDRRDVTGWAQEIEALQEKRHWREASARARARLEAWDPEALVSDLERRLGA